MYVVAIREIGDPEQIERSADLVSTSVAPRVRQAPGFVSAMWMSDGEGGTLNVIAFDSEATARAAIDAARNSPRPPFLHVEHVELLRVLATA